MIELIYKSNTNSSIINYFVMHIITIAISKQALFHMLYIILSKYYISQDNLSII